MISSKKNHCGEEEEDVSSLLHEDLPGDSLSTTTKTCGGFHYEDDEDDVADELLVLEDFEA